MMIYPLTRMQTQNTGEGSFKKSYWITSINNIESFIYSLDHLKTDNTGLLNIVFCLDGSDKWCDFVPDSGEYPNEKYTDTFDFARMFQWK